MRWISFCASLACLASGCGTGPLGDGTDAGHGSAGDGSTGLDASDVIEVPDGGPHLGRDGGAPPVQVLVYAHTDTTLYSGDPTATPMTLTKIGDFDCVAGSAMTDLAIDQAGNLFGVTTTAVHPLTIQGTTVHCAATWPLPGSTSAHFYGLTFAPAGILRASEMLVAANSAGELWAIDEQGHTTQVGTFGAVPANDGHGHSYANAGKAWELSGDIVFLSNNGNPIGFATVRDCPSPPSSASCDRVDTLVEIDVRKLALGNTTSVLKTVRGQVVKSASCTDTSTTGGYGSMYGIAAWNDKVYGFSRTGNLVAINNSDGTACLVQTYAGDLFAGAGVSTMAPVIGPN